MYLLNSKFHTPAGGSNSKAGFTVIELLVVLSIMGLLAGAVVANYAGQRVPRNLLIAQNELVSNIRLLQSYTFSSRNSPGGAAAQYYIIKFDSANPRQYLLQAIYNASTPPAKVQTLQTVSLPPNIRLSATAVAKINGVIVSTGCALLGFKLPFGKVIMNNGCTLPNDPTITSNDDYDKIVSYISNSGSGTVFSDVPIIFSLTDDQGRLTKNVTVSGATGAVIAAP